MTARATTRTTPKNSRLVDGRGTTPRASDKSLQLRTSTTKRMFLQPVLTSAIIPRHASTYTGPSFFGVPLSMPINWNTSSPYLRNAPLSSNLTGNEWNESSEKLATDLAVNATTVLDPSMPLATTTDDYGPVGTTTNEPSTGSTRKKLKRRIRINAETGQRQVMKRRKVLKDVPAEEEAPE